MKQLQVLDLFSGIGGISLGLSRAGGFSTIAFCEIDPFCRAVLRRHWPGIPVYPDIHKVRRQHVGKVDLIAGGFPCQPVSVAGKRNGQDDARWLWPEMFRVVREVRPRWVLAENVPGLRTMGADGVLADLEAEQYTCWPLVVGADDVGAPHRRKRVWIVARFRLAERDGARERDADKPRGEQRPSGPRAPDAGGSRAAGVGDAANARTQEPEGADGFDSERQAQRRRKLLDSGPGAAGRVVGRSSSARNGRDSAGTEGGSLRWPARPGEPQHEWEAPRLVELGVGGPADGVPERLVRAANKHALRAYGNAVVPQVVEQIGRAILEAESVML